MLAEISEVNVYTAIGAALAVVSTGAIMKVVSMFLKHITSSDERQEAFLGNHMSGNTKALEAVASRLENLERTVAAKSVKVVNAEEVEVKP